MTKVKRPDIQGIRGEFFRRLAIAAVFAFHLNSYQFPAGFVGVDTFFVLSGYLMSSILARETVINKQVLLSFYTRRFKRIVPLYSILLVAMFILVPIILLARDVNKFIPDSIWAALFATNILSLVEKTDYFTELFDSNVLTHTWSLGVEIQYYLIVPFLICLQRRLGERWGRPYLIGMIGASFLFQCITSANVSFNALPSRIWQFLAGGIAHELISWLDDQRSNAQSKVPYSTLPSSDNVYLLETEKVEKRREVENREHFVEPSKTSFRSVLSQALPALLSNLLFLITLSPFTILPDEALRATAIVLTTAIIVLGRVEENQSWLLTNRLIVYLGDISYVVYLVHWPVVVMWKSYWDASTLSGRDVLICISVTFLISIIVHHTVEKMFISASTTVSCSFVAVIYLLMVSAAVFSLPQKMNELAGYDLPKDQRFLAAVKFNEEESHLREHGSKRPFVGCNDDPEGILMRDGYYKQHAYSCLWKPHNPNGTVRILVVGNSIAHRATKILHPILKSNKEVKEMRLFANAACQPLVNRHHHAEDCTEFFDAMRKLVKLIHHRIEEWSVIAYSALKNTEDATCRPLDSLRHAGDCTEFFDAMRKLVKRMRPDITMFIYDDSKALRSPIVDISKERPLADFVEFLKPLSANSKYLVLDEFYPKAGTLAGVSLSMYKRLLRKQSLDDLRTPYKAFTDAYSSYFKRLDQLPSRIPNLIRHNTSGPLCADGEGSCWWYNRKNLHSYYTDHSHFTTDGLELQRESYTRILEDLIGRIKKSNLTRT